MRRLQPNQHTALVIKFLTTLSRRAVDPDSGSDSSGSESDPPHDTLESVHQEWKDTVSTCYRATPCSTGELH